MLKITVRTFCVSALSLSFSAQSFAISSSEFATNSLTRHRVDERSLSYQISCDALQQGNIKSFIEILPKGTQFHLNPMYPQLSRVDRSKNWNKAQGNVHIMVTKMSYVVNKSVDFFSPQRLSDLSFIQTWMGDRSIFKLNAQTVRFPGGSNSPGFDQFMDVSQGADEISRRAKDISALDPMVGAPSTIRFTENTNFTKIMGKDTSHSSQTVTAVYKCPNEEQSLLVQTSVSYLYNVPPKLLGGTARLINGVQETVLKTVSNLDQIEP